jgi:hypothetical protein
MNSRSGASRWSQFSRRSYTERARKEDDRGDPEPAVSPVRRDLADDRDLPLVADSTTYYWRIAFSDDGGATGACSTATSTFSLATNSATSN